MCARIVDDRYDDLATMELRRQIYVDLMRMRHDFPAHHLNAVARILFVFAHMHPDIGYVQVPSVAVCFTQIHVCFFPFVVSRLLF